MVITRKCTILLNAPTISEEHFPSQPISVCYGLNSYEYFVRNADRWYVQTDRQTDLKWFCNLSVMKPVKDTCYYLSLLRCASRCN